LLAVENNFTADRKIRQAIKQKNPSLLKQLEFDPDADFVSIITANQAAIREAAEIIQSILPIRRS